MAERWIRDKIRRISNYFKKEKKVDENKPEFIPGRDLIINLININKQEGREIIYSMIDEKCPGLNVLISDEEISRLKYSHDLTELIDEKIRDCIENKLYEAIKKNDEAASMLVYQDEYGGLRGIWRILKSDYPELAAA